MYIYIYIYIYMCVYIRISLSTQSVRTTAPFKLALGMRLLRFRRSCAQKCKLQAHSEHQIDAGSGGSGVECLFLFSRSGHPGRPL